MEAEVKCGLCNHPINLNGSHAIDTSTREHFCLGCENERARKSIKKEYEQECAKIEPYMKVCKCGTTGYSEDPKYATEEYICFDCIKKQDKE